MTELVNKMNVFRTNIHFGLCTTLPDHVSDKANDRQVVRGKGSWIEFEQLNFETAWDTVVWEHAQIQRPISLKTWSPFHHTTFVLKFQLGNHMVFTNKISKEKLLGGTAGVF